MAEPNPKIVKSRPTVPAGDDLAKFDVGNVPALPDPDDIAHLDSLAAQPDSGDTDNFDINPAIQGPRDPSAGYASDNAANFPVPES